MTCGKGCGEMESLRPVNCKLIQLLWKTIWRFFKKLKTKHPYYLVISLLDIYQKKTIIQTDVCTLMLIAEIFTKSRYGSY